MILNILRLRIHIRESWCCKNSRLIVHKSPQVSHNNTVHLVSSSKSEGIWMSKTTSWTAIFVGCIKKPQNFTQLLRFVPFHRLQNDKVVRPIGDSGGESNPHVKTQRGLSGTVVLLNRSLYFSNIPKINKNKTNFWLRPREYITASFLGTRQMLPTWWSDQS